MTKKHSLLCSELAFINEELNKEFLMQNMLLIKDELGRSSVTLMDFLIIAKSQLREMTPKSTGAPNKQNFLFYILTAAD